MAEKFSAQGYTCTPYTETVLGAPSQEWGSNETWYWKHDFGPKPGGQLIFVTAGCAVAGEVGLAYQAFFLWDDASIPPTPADLAVQGLLLNNVTGGDYQDALAVPTQFWSTTLVADAHAWGDGEDATITLEVNSPAGFSPGFRLNLFITAWVITRDGGGVQIPRDDSGPHVDTANALVDVLGLWNTVNVGAGTLTVGDDNLDSTLQNPPFLFPSDLAAWNAHAVTLDVVNLAGDLTTVQSPIMVDPKSDGNFTPLDDRQTIYQLDVETPPDSVDAGFNAGSTALAIRVNNAGDWPSYQATVLDTGGAGAGLRVGGSIGDTWIYIYRLLLSPALGLWERQSGKWVCVDVTNRKSPNWQALDWHWRNTGTWVDIGCTPGDVR